MDIVVFEIQYENHSMDHFQWLNDMTNKKHQEINLMIFLYEYEFIKI